MKPLQLRVPELVPGVDVRKLPLSAVEGFVLSRIDGRSVVADIVSLTGLGLDQVGPIVDKLVTLGAARWAGEAREASSTNVPPVAAVRPLPSRPSQPPAAPVRPAPSSSLPPPSASRAPGSASPPPHTAARRRPFSGSPPRRMMAESGISQAPPDFRPSHPPSGAPRSPSKHPAPHAPPAGARHDPVQALFESVEESHRTMPRMERPDTSRRPEPVRTEAIPPGPPSQPDLVAAMLDVDLPYDPTELMEQVDLPLARRKEVLDLYYRLEHLDHYELLGIAYDADKKDVRAAYFALSKVFHPDTMFRKNLGSFKARMEVVFRQLTEAYDTLGKKKSREEYDRYLQATKKIQVAERAMRMDAQRDLARAEVEISQMAPAPAPSLPPPSQPVAPPREITDEARRLAQQIMQRRLRGLGAQRPPVAPVAPAPVATPSIAPPTASKPPAARTDPQELLRRLTRTLKDVGGVTGTSDQLTRHVKGSQNAFVRGDLAEATKQMQRAVSLAPEREDLRMEFDRLSKMLSEKLASDYEEQARFEQKSNKWASAALSWAKVCEGKPRDAAAHRSAAHALLKAGGDLRGAQKYAQQAVFLAPDDIDGHLLLAQLYLTLGLKLNAKRELDLASKLDPGHEMVKNLLADMKG